MLGPGGLDSGDGKAYKGKVMDKPSPPAQPEQEPYPGEQNTRLSGAWTALVIALLGLVLLLVFILQNLQNVELSFLIFHGHLPLAIALLFGVVLGAIIVLGFGAARIMQLRMVARSARRQGPTPRVRPDQP
jgi:lipopolysaccharide assembly protein A